MNNTQKLMDQMIKRRGVPVSTETLAELIGVTKQQVSSIISSLRTKGDRSVILDKVSNGVYVYRGTRTDLDSTNQHSSGVEVAALEVERPNTVKEARQRRISAAYEARQTSAPPHAERRVFIVVADRGDKLIIEDAETGDLWAAKRV